MPAARPDDAPNGGTPTVILSEEEARRRRQELLTLLRRGGYNVEQIAQITGWAGRTIRRALGKAEVADDAPAPIVGAAHPRGTLALGLTLTRDEVAAFRTGLAPTSDGDRDAG